MKLSGPLSDSDSNSDPTADRLLMRQIDVSPDGTVANANDMEYQGEARVVSISLQSTHLTE
jgi:hypothetical protein